MSADLLVAVPPDVLDELRARYGEPQRAYHTWAHLEALLSWYAEVRPALNDAQAVLYAVLFHDAVYDPTRGDNEALSAVLLRDRMAGRLPTDTLEQAAGLIGATHRHLLPEGLSAEAAGDAALFLDMDLSILGAPEAVFDAYEVNVRTEYAHVPEAAFRAGRAAILSAFLGRERLYFSDWGHARFEAAARANLSRSIAALSA